MAVQFYSRCDADLPAAPRSIDNCGKGGIAMAIERKVDKDDLLSRLRIKETLLFGLITIAALFANLPHETLEDMGVNQGYLLALLFCGVVVGLFFYLKFFF